MKAEDDNSNHTIKKLISCTRIGGRVSEFFTSTINVKHGGVLSPNVFGFCSELEQIIDEIV